MNRRRHSCADGQCGAVLVELALIVPLLTLMLLFVSDCVLSLIRYTEVSAISRELGMLALRDCSRLSAPQPCLDGLTTRLQQSSAHPLELSLELSIYRNNGGSPALISRTSSSTLPSRYIFTGSRLSNIVTNHPEITRLVVSQAHYPARGFIAGDLIGDIYEATIF